MLYALVAPRPLMMSTALHDSVENTWAIEKFFEEIHKVYDLLGHPRKYRPALSSRTARPGLGDVCAHNEFLERAIERKSIAEAFPYRPYHAFDYDQWAKKNPPAPAPAKLPAQAGRVQIVEHVRWLLGKAPPTRAPVYEIKTPAKAEDPTRVDFDQILAAAAPKPMLVIAPQRDWHATHAEVATAVTRARMTCAKNGAGDRLTLESPDRWLEYNRPMQAQTVDWLRRQSSNPASAAPR